MSLNDPTLYELFKAESEEHLQRLDEALLGLESRPQERFLLEEAFREAHTLKGSARMMGLSGIQVLAHALEDGLNAARQGTLLINAGVISGMLREVADIRGRVEETLRAARADGVATVQQATKIMPVLVSEVAEVADVAEVAEGNKEPTAIMPTAVEEGFRIDSVRVGTRRLDELMTHSGELVIARNRVARRISELDAVLDELAALSRDLPSNVRPAIAQIEEKMLGLRRASGEDGSRLEDLSRAFETSVREMRLLPMANIFKMFPRMVREIAEELGKEVTLQLQGAETLADKRVLEEIKDPLMHMVRNAIGHGIESPERREALGKPRHGTITLRAAGGPLGLTVTISDDGAGLDIAAIRLAAKQRQIVDEAVLAAMSAEELNRLILHPGFSTARFVTDVTGRGVGMDVVHTNILRLKGTLDIASVPGEGTRFGMHLPVTLVTLQVFLVRVNGFFYGFPIEAVGAGQRLAASALFAVEGRNTALYRGMPVPVLPLAEILELPGAAATAANDEPRQCIFLNAGEHSFGVLVDAAVDAQEVVLKPQSPVLGGVPNIMGAAILSSGDICMVLNAADLLASVARKAGIAAPPAPAARIDGEDKPPRPKRILLAEDSITTRTQEVRILEAAGYQVVAAIDGLDAFTKLGGEPFDALVSDINMPRMDGLELAERVRSLAQYAEMPIILVTSLSSDEDKRRGLEIGANAYITKPEFDQRLLLDCLQRLIG